ncbi:MAG: glycosyltransferase [Myxococcales bacterium]|nr:glycosyltransferase [Myxococcales bacterium]
MGVAGEDAAGACGALHRVHVEGRERVEVLDPARDGQVANQGERRHSDGGAGQVQSAPGGRLPGGEATPRAAPRSRCARPPGVRLNGSRRCTTVAAHGRYHSSPRVRGLIVDCVIPARDEAGAIGGVIAALPEGVVRRVVVVDNGSRDRTAEVARSAGADVVSEPERGYGAACLAGIRRLTEGPEGPPDVVVFLDGDHADDPREVAALLLPIARGEADLVIGSRTLGQSEAGALTPQQRIGNLVAVRMIGVLYRHQFTDLGPFRAIRFPSLCALGMRDRDYGWTAEMQVKALRGGLAVVEVPVSYYRRRAGVSKVASTVRGTIGAGYKILYTILRYAVAR